MREIEQRLLETLLVDADDDWVSIDSLYHCAAHLTGSSVGSSRVIRPVVARVLEEELAMIGTVDGEFRPWPWNKVESLRRINDFLDRHPNGLQPSNEFWFTLTPKGKALIPKAKAPVATAPNAPTPTKRDPVAAEAVDSTVLAIVLIYGLDDWVPIDSVYGAVHYVTGSSRGARLVVRRVVHRLLDDGLAVVGKVWDGFQPWPGTTAEHLRRIDEFINENPDDLDISFEFWFHLTPAGEEFAATVPDPYADDPDW